jgi:hypothetical protein
MLDSLKYLFPFDPEPERTLRRRIRENKTQSDKMVNGDDQH